MNKQHVKHLSTIGSKVEETKQRSERIEKEFAIFKNSISNTFIWGGVFILVAALFWDVIAQATNHRHNPGISADQIFLMLIGLMIAVKGWLIRRKK